MSVTLMWRRFDPSSSPSASLGRSPIFSARTCGELSPVAAAISHLNSGLLIGRAGSLFSELPISLRNSGLCGFGTVLEIRIFREAYESKELGVLRRSSDRQEHPISNSHTSRFESPAPASQFGAQRNYENSRFGRICSVRLA